MTAGTFLFVEFRQLGQNPPKLTTETDIMRSLLLIGLLFAAGASADSITSQIKGCSTIESDSERLSCYDALSQSLEQRAERDFGQEQQRIAEEAPESITATITDIQKAAYGKLLITLDNGQVWRQNDSTRVFWKSGDSVEVERAMFGSFFMREVEGSRKMRVKRER